jgi:hypothetical protein
MAYIYQTLIDLRSEDADQLRIGKSLGLSLAYLKALLPNEPGFINVRAMVSMAKNDKTYVVLESSWEDWESLETHLEKSPFAEQKIFPRFDLQVMPLEIKTAIYEEVG